MTRNLPANPMQALIAAAARTKSTTGATAAYKRRLEASGPQVVLAGVSQSMELPAGGSLRRIDHLRSALDAVFQPEHLLMSFASAPQWQPSRYLPDPSGGTALHLALDLAAGRAPAMTLVISDGEPNDEDAALAAAGRLTGTISVIYCGREDNVQALGFMRRLARAGLGQCHVHRWDAPLPRERLQQTMRLLLASP